MSIEKKSLISTLKTTKKANAVSSEVGAKISVAPKRNASHNLKRAASHNLKRAASHNLKRAASHNLKRAASHNLKRYEPVV